MTDPPTPTPGTTRLRPAGVRSARLAAGTALVAALVLASAGCGGGPAPQTAAPPPVASTTTGAATTTPASAGGPATAAEPGSGAGAVGGLPSACSLVPQSEISAASGLRFGPPAATDGARRSVCAFAATASSPGLSVGVEPAGRFEAKAEASRRSVGVPGTPVPGLGEQALFFYSAADLPEGIGGVLVRSGAATVDITVQGVGDEARTREAAVAVARVALDRL